MMTSWYKIQYLRSILGATYYRIYQDQDSRCLDLSVWDIREELSAGLVKTELYTNFTLIHSELQLKIFFLSLSIYFSLKPEKYFPAVYIQGSCKKTTANRTFYLLPTYYSTRLALNHHVLSTTKVESSWSKRTRFLEVIHDGSYFLRLELIDEQGQK